MICGWRPLTSSNGETSGVSDVSRGGRCSKSSGDIHLGGFSHSFCCLGLRCPGCSSSVPSSSSYIHTWRYHTFVRVKKACIRLKEIKCFTITWCSFYIWRQESSRVQKPQRSVVFLHIFSFNFFKNALLLIYYYFCPSLEMVGRLVRVGRMGRK